MNMLCLGWRTITTCGGVENGYGRNQVIVPPSTTNGADSGSGSAGSGCSTPVWFYLGLAAVALMAVAKK